VRNPTLNFLTEQPARSRFFTIFVLHLTANSSIYTTSDLPQDFISPRAYIKEGMCKDEEAERIKIRKSEKTWALTAKAPNRHAGTARSGPPPVTRPI
jgi:hypothetical protein